MSRNFCSECGSSLQVGDAFCPNCGHRFESQRIEKVHQSEEPQKSGMSKKKKIMIGIVAVIAIALFSTHTYIKSIISPEKQVTMIYEALHEGNGEKLL